MGVDAYALVLLLYQVFFPIKKEIVQSVHKPGHYWWYLSILSFISAHFS